MYHARRGIETAFRELKYGFGLVNLHGKKDDFVKQEIYSAMIMFNFCGRIVNEIVVHKNDTNIHEYKVNMKMAIRPGRRDKRNIKPKSFVGFIYRVSA